ncbi:MAG: hypothetical protein PWP65_938 [Clostridia bacterium]|nr:hypothetical protein [Clostridia bacterium]
MLVRDVMSTEVLRVKETDLIGDVLKTFIELKMSHAVVEDDQGKLVGILTDGDIMAAIRQRRPVYIDLFNAVFVLEDNAELKNKAQALVKLPVREIMTKKVASVTEDTSLVEVAGIMADRKIKQVPVVREGRVIGIIRRQDIIQVVANQ